MIHSTSIEGATPPLLDATTTGRFRGTDDALIIDCDGVVLNWLEGFQTYAEKRLGRTLCNDGPAAFDLAEWLGLDDVADAITMVRDFNAGDCGSFGKLNPEPGAVSALHAFHATGRPIHMITACSLDPAVIAMRKENLTSVFGAIFTEIHCVDVRDSKLPLLSEYRAATWVEDKLENAIDGAQAGHRTYLVRAPHNRAREAATVVSGLSWVDGWDDIRMRESF